MFSMSGNIYSPLKCHLTRLILAACLLVVAVEGQGESTTPEGEVTINTTPPPPSLENFRTLDEIKEIGRAYMRHCDTDSPIYDDDKFCDRFVGITAHLKGRTNFGDGQIINSGIFIDSKRILTSYTPFRILRNYVKRAKMYIHYITARAYNLTHKDLVGYYHDRQQIACARQVVAMEDKEIVEDQWHGTDHTHTPLHDLMIMKIENELEFVNKSTHKMALNNDTKVDVSYFGPVLTELAGENDHFPEKFKFISLGFIDNDHIYKKNHLHTSREYELDDKVIENCEEWFPRDWGYFFCIKNDDDYVGIGSGAILVANEKVFGFGCFALKKGKQSILVFTDIRPYHDAMNMTCNEFDGH